MKGKLYSIFALAFLLRVWQLKDNLFFGFEQGRDLLAVKAIAGGDFALIGPWTSIPGFFHGGLSYWVLVPPYLISRGDPFLILVFLIIGNLIGLFFLYKSMVILYDKRAAIVTLILVSTSYVSVVYARWLSNPNLVPAVFGMMIYSLARAKKDIRFFPLIFLFWGAMFHFQAIIAILIFPAVIFALYKFRLRPKRRQILQTVLVLGFVYSSYAVFELRNEFIMSKSLVSFFADSGGREALRATSSEIIEQMANEVETTLIPGQRALSLITLFGAFAISRKSLSWAFLFSMASFFLFFQVKPLPHYLMLFHIFIYMSLGVATSSIRIRSAKVISYTLITLVVLFNLYEISRRIPENIGIFLYHAQRTYLGDEKRLIEFAYDEARGAEFSYDYFTVPYWQREHWQYLFGWYGRGRYGYIPSENRTETFFTLIEPDETQPKFQEDWYKELNGMSELLESFESGKLIVEKRVQK